MECVHVVCIHGRKRQIIENREKERENERKKNALASFAKDFCDVCTNTGKQFRPIPNIHSFIYNYAEQIFLEASSDF